MKKKWRYGSKIFVKDGRKKPWLARINIGYDINGYPVSHILDSFEDELDCILCLRNYTNNPWDITVEKEKMNKIVKFINLPSKLITKEQQFTIVDRTFYTFEQVYKEWSKLYYPTKEEIEFEKNTHIKAKGKFTCSHMANYRAAYNKCEKLYNIPYKNLRTVDFEAIINTQTGSSTKIKMFKLLFQQLDNYALQKDITTRGFAQFINIELKESKKPVYENDFAALEKNNRKPFSYDEINAIWNADDCLVKDILLILMYTGMRIEELLFLHNNTINLKDNYLIAGLKTENGRNRIIPIHNKIKYIIRKYYEDNNDYFIRTNGKKVVKRLSYQTYHTYFKDFMKELKMKHTTHDTRHTFRSELDRLNVKEKIIDLILGHKSSEIGKRVYTHKTVEELEKAVNLVTYKKTNKLYVISAS